MFPKMQELAKEFARDAVRVLDPYFQAVEDSLVECCRAVRRFKPFNSSHEGFAVLKEELDEMWEAIKANDLVSAHEGAIQVAAVALRFIAEVPITKECQAEEEPCAS